MKKRKPTISKRIWTGMTLCGLLFFRAQATDLVPFADISPAQAAALIKEKGSNPLFTILDVRTVEEYAESRISGALNIDVKREDFREKIEKLDKEGAYLVYCRGGVRSGRAMNLMKEWRFKQVYNLEGGLLNWEKEKLPLESGLAKSSGESTPLRGTGR